MTLAELLTELEIERMQPTRPALTNQTLRKARRLLAVRERARFERRQSVRAKKPTVPVTVLMEQVEKIKQLKAKMRRIT